MALLAVFSILLYVLPSVILAQTALSTGDFDAQFAVGSGVLQSLRPKAAPGFDFSPSDYFQYRSGNGNYHTGDLTLQFRASAASSWASVDTSANRNARVTPVATGSDRVSFDLTPALGGLNGALNITRTWSSLGKDIGLEFTIRNTAVSSVEIGSLGMPIEFNNIFTNRTAVDTTQKCVFVDAYIGLDAGYVQVTRMTGTGPNMVVTPINNATKLEAWRFLSEPFNRAVPYQQQTYEGNYEWDVFTRAFTDTQWKSVQPWNPATSRTLAAGQSLTVGLRFAIAAQVQTFESTVGSKDVPVAVGIPGYVLPSDIQGRLFINSSSAIVSSSSDSNTIAITQNADVSGWKAFTLQAASGTFGRTRIVLSFADGRSMAVHYHVAAAGATTLSQLSNFLTTTQWYTNSSDVFNRSPSVISYDDEVKNYVLQYNRAWIAGLSDEGGAGSFLAAGMKQAFSPDAAQVAKIETFVNETVWGDLQISSGSNQYAVRKSLFFYDPSAVPGYTYSPSINWGGTWNKNAAYLIDRGYDYVHVSNLYWSLYQAGRTHPNMLTHQYAKWYLLQAYNTVMFVYKTGAQGQALVDYGNVGLMGETVWGNILTSLREEALSTEASALERVMRGRQSAWATQPDPYSSEMAWDSTGEEGVYYWSIYFNDTATATETVNAIRGYMPTIPHWGWNGNARRYWDFLYGGKYPGIERQIHHYGSGLNALPLLDNYRRSSDPSSLQAIYDLRVGYGGNQGPLSNIHADGFASMAFHSFPQNLYWDPYTGDYGPNFVGHALGVGTYLVQHPTFGWISFGGNVVVNATQIVVTPKDTLRKRVYVAPLGAYFELDAGVVSRFTYDAAAQLVTLVVDADDGTSLPLRATLAIRQGNVGKNVVVQSPQLNVNAQGAYVIDFSGGSTQTIVLGVK